jgi:hypothetical protein
MNTEKKKTVVEKKPAASAKNPSDTFAFTRDNYKWLIIGILVSFIGFILMSGGGTSDPTQFNGSSLFSPMRLTVAPILVLGGFGLVLYAIIKKPKE